MVERVGIVAKLGQDSVAPHLVEVAVWLEARGVEPVFEADAARLLPPAPRAPDRDPGRPPLHGRRAAGAGRRRDAARGGRPREPGRARPSHPRRELRTPRVPHRNQFPRAVPAARIGHRRARRHRAPPDHARARAARAASRIAEHMRVQRRRDHARSALAHHRTVGDRRRRVRGALQRRRPDHRQPDGIDRLQPVGRRAHPAPGGRRARS